MQVRKREGRSFECLGKSGEYSLARFGRVGFLLSIIFFSSCSLFQKKKADVPVDEQVARDIRSLCFVGEGKGRMEFSRNRYVFSYEAIEQFQENRWSLGMQLPLYGEEILHIGYGKSEHDKIVLGGSFYKRLMQEIRKEGAVKTERLLKVFFNRVARFMRLKRSFAAGKRPACEPVQKGKNLTVSNCRYGDFQFQHEIRSNHHKFIIPIGHRSIFVVDGFDESEGVFRRASLAYHSRKEAKALLKLQLFVSSCLQQ